MSYGPAVVREVPPEYAYRPGWVEPSLIARGQAEDAFGFPAPISNRALHMDRITARLRTDIPSFLRTYFDFPNDEYEEPGKVVPHVVNLLEEMFIGGKIVAMWSTDHAKSMTADKFFPILSLAENPDESHLLMGANFLDTKRRLQVIQRELETNHALIKDFPWLAKPKGRKGLPITWSRVELTVAGRSTNRPDPSVYACAIGSNDIRGRRGKLIMDDIEGVRNSRYQLSRQEMYEFIKREATRCKEDITESKRPLLIALGTPFDADSLYLRLELEDWRVIRVPAYTVPYAKIEQSAYMKDAQGVQMNTQTPWQQRAERLPERYFTWPRKRLKVCEADPHFGHGLSPTQFAIQYLLDPTLGKPGRLSLKQMEDLVKASDLAEPGDWKTLVSLDPASGSNTRFADYCGISAVRIRWPAEEHLPDVQVLEAHRYEQGLMEQVDFCADLCAKYDCDLMYESNSQQGQIYPNAFRYRRPNVRLIPTYTTQAAKFNEQMGLTVIKTLIRSEKLKVPASRLSDEGMQTLLGEVRDFDVAGDMHDHIACSVWFVVRWLYEQVQMLSRGPAQPVGFGRRFGASTGGYFRQSSRDWRTWSSRRR